MKTGTTNKVYMVFKTSEGDKATLSVDRVDPDIDDSKIEEVMDLIIAKNIFKSSQGEDLVGKVEAKLVVEQVQAVHLTDAKKEA
ncbi:DUF2922 domain-containing protein [Tepidibacter sp. Z1-5]|uniref:DUF2922 domain-containing protein n=1 Tax=Tepidibacter sp. Z1-5 TaxID=3134138 RepID=UPI0030C5A16D